jgi:histidyl-tRNA synthetase
VSELIEPRTLKGFRDYLPDVMIVREQLMETARRVYRSYGFSPIDTPALEYAEILVGKGGEESDKQLYRFIDNGDRDIALRFDLTVPFARFAAEHLNEIGTPFKRYHIAPVWRGENTQRGRYREFVQCDFDTIGTDSNVSDIETLMVIHDLMKAIGFERFTIRVNHRMLLNGVLENLGVADKSVGLLRALDKVLKIGREAVIAEMVDKVGVNAEQAAGVLDFASLKGTNLEILDAAEKLVGTNERGLDGAARLRQLLNACERSGISGERIALDLSIARGLDYYTGTIYETFLGDLPGIGSVCSGGRYDNLAGLFTKTPLPGVGASLGLDRLLAAMEELKLVSKVSTPAPVLVVHFDKDKAAEYLRIGRVLRAAGIGTEVYAAPKPMKKQMQYADSKGFRFALIAGSNEFDKGCWMLKDLARKEQLEVPEADLISTLQGLLK